MKRLGDLPSSALPGHLQLPACAVQAESAHRHSVLQRPAHCKLEIQLTEKGSVSPLMEESRKFQAAEAGSMGPTLCGTMTEGEARPGLEMDRIARPFWTSPDFSVGLCRRFLLIRLLVHHVMPSSQTPGLEVRRNTQRREKTQETAVCGGFSLAGCLYGSLK